MSFQHTAARRRLPQLRQTTQPMYGFNTQPPEGGCLEGFQQCFRTESFNTQRPEGGCFSDNLKGLLFGGFQHTAARRRLHGKAIHTTSMAGFNTQPPEGGCKIIYLPMVGGARFQHTAARRRLRGKRAENCSLSSVSTHSRPKAAAHQLIDNGIWHLFQHTAARRRLPDDECLKIEEQVMFQHTAARRRLLPFCLPAKIKMVVSTHSRPKAAAASLLDVDADKLVSTHSRPKAAAYKK